MPKEVPNFDRKSINTETNIEVQSYHTTLIDVDGSARLAIAGWTAYWLTISVRKMAMDAVRMNIAILRCRVNVAEGCRYCVKTGRWRVAQCNSFSRTRIAKKDINQRAPAPSQIDCVRMGKVSLKGYRAVRTVGSHARQLDKLNSLAG